MNKKYVAFWIICWLTITTLLTACGDASVKTVVNDGSARFKGIDGSVKVITDNESGCKYIFIEDGFGESRTEAFAPLVKNKDEFDCGQY